MFSQLRLSNAGAPQQSHCCLLACSICALFQTIPSVKAPSRSAVWELVRPALSTPMTSEPLNPPSPNHSDTLEVLCVVLTISPEFTCAG